MQPPPAFPMAASRRAFLKTATTGAALAAAAAVRPQLLAAAARRGIALGYDNFAVRAMRWDAARHIEYAASLGCDSLFLSDINAETFPSYERAALEDLRQRADDRGLKLHVGTWSICPTSRTFRDTWGTAEEHLRLAIRVAQHLGSPVIRVVLGSMEDRRTEGGIQARIRDTVQVCRACRTQALDAGVKIAMENHAGDMQAWEVVTLIEEAGGREYMGANLDSGNAVWTLEDPLASLEILGPYALTTSLRDSAVWLDDQGAVCQWTAMGDGMVDWPRYFERFAELCPGVPVHIETISGFNRPFGFYDPAFWEVFPEARARDLARFVAWARGGTPRAPWQRPEGTDRTQAEQEYQRAEIERSLRYCRSIGLGLKG